MCSWPKIPETPLHLFPCENFCWSSFSVFLSPFSFLADLMDNSELIRNVTLCGHLHHGKVRELSSACSRVPLCSCFFFKPLGWGLSPWGWTSWIWGTSMLLVKPHCEILKFPEQQVEPITKSHACLSHVSASGQKRGDGALLWFYVFSFPWRYLSRKDCIFHLKIILWLQC